MLYFFVDIRWIFYLTNTTATALFRFRKIPGLTVDTSLYIICEEKRYRIISAENIRGRGMYVEVLTEIQEGTVR